MKRRVLPSITQLPASPAGENVPASQSEQLREPAVENLPESHDTHKCNSGRPKVPAGQSEQCVPLLVLPAPHWMHAADSAALVQPGAHCVHDASEAADQVPAGQAVQLREPNVATRPLAHAVQALPSPCMKRKRLCRSWCACPAGQRLQAPVALTTVPLTFNVRVMHDLHLPLSSNVPIWHALQPVPSGNATLPSAQGAQVLAPWVA